MELSLKIANERGIVYWSDVEKTIDWGKLFSGNAISLLRNAKNYRIRKNQTIKDYIKTLWNTTKKKGYCPYLYFSGFLQPIGKDKEGNLIYKANKNFADL